MPELPEGFKLPPGVNPVDLSRAKEFDPRNLPDGVKIEFSIIDFSFYLETLADGNSAVRLIWFTPMLPFIKFSIPWDVEALVNLKDKVEKAIMALIETQGKDIPVANTPEVPPTDSPAPELPFVPGEPN